MIGHVYHEAVEHNHSNGLVPEEDQHFWAAFSDASGYSHDQSFEQQAAKVGSRPCSSGLESHTSSL